MRYQSHPRRVGEFPRYLLVLLLVVCASASVAWADTTPSAGPVAVFTAPAPGTTQVDPQTTFSWSTVQGAQAYYLYVGSTLGANDLVNSGELQTTSLQVSGLPAGGTVYARLNTKYGGAWNYIDLTLTVRPIATFTAPTANQTNVDPRSFAQWQSVIGAQAYYLYIGTQIGLKDLVDTGETQSTQWPLVDVPAGQLVYARLWTKYQGHWQYVDTSFQLEPVAVFINPGPGVTQVPSNQSIVWTNVDGADAYYLYVGTTSGANDLINTGEMQALSWSVQALPRQQTVYARIYTKFAGSWYYVEQSFQVIDTIATLTQPLNGAQNVDTRQPAQWTSISEAQAYYLYVGTTPGAKDLINTGEISATSYNISGLPAGQLVYARLYTKWGGHWNYSDSTFQTLPIAYLTGAVATTGIVQPDTVLTWNPYAGATEYYVYVGTAPGLTDIAQSGEITTTSYQLPQSAASTINSDQTVYVRLWSLVNGTWLSIDYTLQWQAKALLSTPSNAQQNTDVASLLFTWTAVQNAQTYYLYVGTTLGAKDVVDSGETAALEWTAGVLPGGQTLYARLWTKMADGTWRSADSSFSTRPAAAFTYPLPGQVGVSTSSPFTWTAIAGASSYSVELGSSPGATDLYVSGPVTANSVNLPPLSTQGVIYGRIWTSVGGASQFSDTVFTTESTAPQPAIQWSGGSASLVAGQGLQWTASPLAAAYRLTIGAAPGGSELHDSGWIQSVRRLVPNLPAGASLYGTLQTRFLSGATSSQSFNFVVADPTVAFTDQWQMALWVAGQVHDMASTSSVPNLGTILLEVMRSQTLLTADCTTYALAMLQMLQDANVGIQARILNVCLNPNAYDCHTLVEAYIPSLDRWAILDPTFGLAAQRASDSSWASALDLFTATSAGNYASINYQFLTASGSAPANAYYLDYPLLFANVYAPETWQIASGVSTIMPYLQAVGSNTVSSTGFYAIQCPAGQTQVAVMISGASWPLRQDGASIVSCTPGLDNMSYVFSASAISPAEDAYVIYTPLRFVF